jgi:serine/threonine-protein kinase RsbW
MLPPNPQTRTTLCRVARASGDALAEFRSEVGDWLDGRLMIDDDRRADIVLAIDEALSNCAEHAYPQGQGAGTMTLEVSHHDRSLKVCVSDRGAWTEPMPNGPRSARGRGIKLMRQLSDDMSIDGLPGGTTVCLWFADCAPRT